MLQKKDLIILMHMRKDARAQLTKISRETGIPVSTIFDRLKTFRRNYITKHVALLNFPNIGFNTITQLILRVKRDQRNDLKLFLAEHPNVNSLLKVNNGYDFLVECIFRRMQDFEEFQEELENNFVIKAKQIYYVIEDLKREAFLTDKSHINLIEHIN